MKVPKRTLKAPGFVYTKGEAGVEEDPDTLHPEHMRLIIAVLSAVPRVSVRAWKWQPLFSLYCSYGMALILGYNYVLVWATEAHWCEMEAFSAYRALPLSRVFVWFRCKFWVEGVEDGEALECEPLGYKAVLAREQELVEKALARVVYSVDCSGYPCRLPVHHLARPMQ